MTRVHATPTLIFLTTISLMIAGCGGGGVTATGGSSAGGDGGTGGGSGLSGNGPTAVATTFQVDVNSGKVSVVSPPTSGKARPGMFTGNSLGFASSVLTNDTTGTGIRSLLVSVTNNTDVPLGISPYGLTTGFNVVFGQFVNTNGIQDQRPNTNVSTFAGSLPGFADDIASVAEFNHPSGVAVGSDGSIYVADSKNNRIRKISNSLVTTLAGTGAAAETDGPSTKSAFNTPYSVAVNPVDGSLIVADYGGNKIRRVTTTGVVSTVAGTGTAGGANGLGNVATLTNPTAVVVASNGIIYVSEASSNRIRKITLSGSPGSAANYTVSSFAGSSTSGSSDGVGTAATFFKPYGLAVDSNGNVYAADYENNKIREIDPSGNVITIAGSGTESDLDGYGNQATFNHPIGVAFLNGTLFVTENSGDRVREVMPVAGGGPSALNWAVESLAGTGSAGNANGTGSVATFSSPYFLAASPSSSLYIADFGNSLIRRVNPSTGTFPTGTANGVTSSEPVVLSNSEGVLASSDFGQAPFIYYPVALGPGQTSTPLPWNFVIPPGITSFQFQVIVEANTGEFLPLQVASGAGSPMVDVRTFAGNPNSSGFVDGPGASALFDPFTGLAADGTGAIFVADGDNSSIRRIDAFGNVSTIAGTAGSGGGYLDGSGTVAKFGTPGALAVNALGTEVFVADYGEDTVRLVALTGSDPTNSADWTVTTIAGQNGVNGKTDGIGSSATLNGPSCIALTPNGDLYIGEQTGNRIRRISFQGGSRSAAADWLVSTKAGDTSAVNGANGYVNGNGSTVRFAHPEGLACDSAGNLYISDELNCAIRKMDSAGNVSTLAGDGLTGYLDGSGTGTAFYYPSQLTIDSAGYLYVADNFNSVIRRISPSGTVETVAGNSTPGTVNGTGDVAEFNSPNGVAITPSGNLYVSSGQDYSIRLIQTIESSAAGKARKK